MRVAVASSLTYPADTRRARIEGQQGGRVRSSTRRGSQGTGQSGHMGQGMGTQASQGEAERAAGHRGQDRTVDVACQWSGWRV